VRSAGAIPTASLYDVSQSTITCEDYILFANMVLALARQQIVPNSILASSLLLVCCCDKSVQMISEIFSKDDLTLHYFV